MRGTTFKSCVSLSAITSHSSSPPGISTGNDKGVFVDCSNWNRKLLDTKDVEKTNFFFQKQGFLDVHQNWEHKNWQMHIHRRHSFGICTFLVFDRLVRVFLCKIHLLFCELYVNISGLNKHLDPLKWLWVWVTSFYGWCERWKWWCVFQLHRRHPNVCLEHTHLEKLATNRWNHFIFTVSAMWEQKHGANLEYEFWCFSTSQHYWLII